MSDSVGLAVIIGGILLISAVCAVIMQWLDDHPDK